MARRSWFAALCVAGLCGIVAAPAAAQTRLERIRQRGTVVCGVAPGVAGFAEVDARGRYSGFDVDICRALAAAILGNADKVEFASAMSVDAFLKSDRIDLVVCRLTWSLMREGE